MPHSKEPKKRRISMDEIITRYEGGESTVSICRDAGINERWVRSLLRRNGVKMRKAGDYNRLYHLNEQFFDKWTKPMAYVLGFSMFYMSVSPNRSSMAIRVADRILLERIRDAMGATNPINERIHGKSSRTFDLRVHSYHMHERLIKDLGFQHRRTNDMKFPDPTPACRGSLIRGLFDAKGRVVDDERSGFFIQWNKLPRQWARGIAGILTLEGIEFERTIGADTQGIKISDPDAILKFVDFIYGDARSLYRKRNWKALRPFVKERRSNVS